MNIYVGNMSYSVTEDELRQAFEAHGEVTSAKIIMDRDTGRPKGFGFVEMPDNASGEAAVSALNGFDLKGRELKVNEARPKESRGGSRGGGGGFRGGGNRGGGFNRGGGGGNRW